MVSGMLAHAHLLKNAHTEGVVDLDARSVSKIGCNPTWLVNGSQRGLQTISLTARAVRGPSLRWMRLRRSKMGVNFWSRGPPYKMNLPRLSPQRIPTLTPGRVSGVTRAVSGGGTHGPLRLPGGMGGLGRPLPLLPLQRTFMYYPLRHLLLMTPLPIMDFFLRYTRLDTWRPCPTWRVTTFGGCS